MEFYLYLNNGKELNINLCKELQYDISFYLDKNKINFDIYNKIINQNYDNYKNYKQKSNNFCLNENDNIIDKYFINNNFCSEKCFFNGINKLLKINCICNSNIINNFNKLGTKFTLFKCKLLLKKLKFFNIGFWLILSFLVINLFMLFFHYYKYENNKLKLHIKDIYFSNSINKLSLIFTKISKINNSNEFNIIDKNRQIYRLSNNNKFIPYQMIIAYQNCNFCIIFNKVNKLFKIIIQKDYRIVTLSFSYYFFYLSLLFFINALFFNFEFKIKENLLFNQKYSISFNKIFYGMLISYFLTEFISFYLNYMIELKYLLNILKEHSNEKEKKLYENIIVFKIKRKISLYFIFQFISIILIWYYLTIYCIFYNKIQIYWFIQGCICILFDIILSMIYSLFLMLILGISYYFNNYKLYLIFLYLINI